MEMSSKAKGRVAQSDGKAKQVECWLEKKGGSS